MKKENISRTRNYATVVYPESAPENWLSILSDSHVPCFVSPLHDLDLNPNDKLVVEKFQKYVKEYEKHREQYISKYGPLCSLDNNSDVFEYNKCPWPWEGSK